MKTYKKALAIAGICGVLGLAHIVSNNMAYNRGAEDFTPIRIEMVSANKDSRPDLMVLSKRNIAFHYGVGQNLFISQVELIRFAKRKGYEPEDVLSKHRKELIARYETHGDRNVALDPAMISK